MFLTLYLHSNYMSTCLRNDEKNLYHLISCDATAVIKRDKKMFIRD